MRSVTQAENGGVSRGCQRFDSANNTLFLGVSGRLTLASRHDCYIEPASPNAIVVPVDAFRAWAEIDLDALTSNLEVIRRRAGPGVRVMLVVKQDAYGHGAVAIAQHAVCCGIGALGVGTSGEALELRRAGLCLPTAHQSSRQARQPPDVSSLRIPYHEA